MCVEWWQVQRLSEREREVLRAYAGKRARVLCVRLCVEWWLFRLPLSVERERERCLRAYAGKSVC